MVPYMLGVKETNVGIMTSQISGKLLAALTTVGTAEEDYGREVPRMGNTILQPRHQTITGSEVRRVLQPLGHGSLLDGGVRYRAESRNAGSTCDNARHRAGQSKRAGYTPATERHQRQRASQLGNKVQSGPRALCLSRRSMLLVLPRTARRASCMHLHGRKASECVSARGELLRVVTGG